MSAQFPKSNLTHGVNVARVEFHDQLVLTLGFVCVTQAAQQLCSTKTNRLMHGLLLKCVGQYGEHFWQIRRTAEFADLNPRVQSLAFWLSGFAS